MSQQKNHKDTKPQTGLLPEKVLCPFCKNDSTNPIDAKKALADKSFYICLVCGQTFEFDAPDPKPIVS
jgi:transcription elongation factor Elf1